MAYIEPKQNDVLKYFYTTRGRQTYLIEPKQNDVLKFYLPRLCCFLFVIEPKQNDVLKSHSFKKHWIPIRKGLNLNRMMY